ncbi:MAG: DUF2799 domain-containing protein [Gammaproteobacteria bacterium]|nr:DUF2799 domain-containing protein [Gammaproteobacteria bacterium]
MKKWQCYLILASAMGLSACSVMTEKECQVANWYDLGFTDGAAGHTVNAFSERAEDCAKHGIGADRASYLQARQEGLKTYCTKENGYREGASGRPYRGVCDSHSAKQFLPAYQKGKRLYEKKSAVATLERKIQDLDRDIDKHNNDKYRLKKQVINESDKGKRANIILDLERINREIIKLKAKKVQLQLKQKVAEKQLQYFKNVAL